jgi:hypothetical protein
MVTERRQPEFVDIHDRRRDVTMHVMALDIGLANTRARLKAELEEKNALVQQLKAGDGDYPDGATELKRAESDILIAQAAFKHATRAAMKYETISAYLTIREGLHLEMGKKPGIEYPGRSGGAADVGGHAGCDHGVSNSWEEIDLGNQCRVAIGVPDQSGTMLLTASAQKQWCPEVSAYEDVIMSLNCGRIKDQSQDVSLARRYLTLPNEAAIIIRHKTIRDGRKVKLKAGGMPILPRGIQHKMHRWQLSSNATEPDQRLWMTIHREGKGASQTARMYDEDGNCRKDRSSIKAYATKLAIYRIHKPKISVARKNPAQTDDSSQVTDPLVGGMTRRLS